MKHMKQLTKSRPVYAQINIADIFTVFSQILEVLGTMLITKEEMNQDPWSDY